MYVRLVSVYNFLCVCVCQREMRGEIGNEREGDTRDVSQPCVIQLDQMVSRKFSLMLILFM